VYARRGVTSLVFAPHAPTYVAALTRPEYRSVVLVLLASTLGALLSRLSRRFVLPTVVIEIVLGMVIGPQVLDIAHVDPNVTLFANIGLAFLFFFAGIEVVEERVARRELRLGTSGWVVSLLIALPLGFVLQQAGIDAEWWLLAVALCTTALGTLVPILSDARLLSSPFGSAALGTGVAGEFWPIIFISVFLTGVYGALTEILLLIAFGTVVMLTATAVLRARPPRVVRVLQETVHTSGQTAVRASILLLATLVFIASDAGFEYVLGAFAAGLVVGLALDSPEGHVVRLRLEGIGFGFVIPIYFVVTGMNFDLDSLLTATGLSLGVLFLALFLVIRGASALLWVRDMGSRELVGLALCGATGLPLIAAIVGIGEERGAISNGVGASLIGAGMISVLVYPFVATKLVAPPAEPYPAASHPGGPSEELA
jgi:Kef-type K+ transport system membrane component KefB